jgi:UDP-glucuronate 4-epimerase
MKILVTGVAGFIGMHVAARLLDRGDEVVGIDNLNDYYDPKLKQNRLKQLEPYATFEFRRIDLADRASMEELFAIGGFDSVIHLAAQAGVRYSIVNPNAYIDSNVVGFMTVLEGCRHHNVRHLIFGSSSSVYGGNTKVPFEETDRVDQPVSLYAATKKTNELMAYTYSHLYGLPSTGLRFFTVYGPWGRPDMAYFSFTKAILEGRTIDIYNNGNMSRDFTYIDDIVESILKILDCSPMLDCKKTDLHNIYNVGNNTQIPLLDFIKEIENITGIKAKKNMLPMQDGDVISTYASTHKLNKKIQFVPSTDLSKGLEKFISWYKNYCGQNISN